MAAQDSAYYPPGWENPLVAQDDMYYREAINVLQDLYDGKFSSLYIKYHGCVWSEFGNGDDDDNDYGCAADGGDPQWYMGHTQCYRANAAYTLYGVKTGSKTPEFPCSKKHYMNSFFTTLGVEGFAYPFGIDYGDYTATAYCTGDYVYADDYVEKDEGEQMYEASTSYATGCSSTGSFVSATFQGLYCAGSYVIATADNLGSFNKEMNNLGCYQLHGSSNDDDNEDDEDDLENSAAVQLLMYSSSCSHTEYPDKCPDPYGIKRKRDNNLYNAIKKRYRVVNPILPLLSSLLFIGGLVSLLISHKLGHPSQSVKEYLTSGIRGLVRFCLLVIAGVMLLFYTCKDMVSRPQKQTDDPMDSVRDESSQDQPIRERASKSFNRTVSDISQRSQSIQEKLTSYAEEFEDDMEPQIGDYQSPEGNVMENIVEEEEKSDEDNVIVAKAILAEKATDLAQEEKVKKHKRPRLAKWSKILFAGKKKKDELPPQL